MAASSSDSDFPPNDTSLGTKKQLKEIGLKKTKGIKWKTGRELAGDREAVVFHSIEPSDIQQGKLGDCYFLSSLSALAEHPERVRRIFQDGSSSLSSNEGMKDEFSVRFNKNGHFVDVTVDSYFPVDDDGQPLFSHTGADHELWVLVLEKAYAKLHGSYAAIDGGNAAAALTDLTGAPSESVELASVPDRDELWKRIATWDRHQFPMGASLPEHSGDLEADLGLPENHVYSVLRVAEVNGERILQIRNPWGKTEWKGKWGDGWDGWRNEELAQKLNFVEADDGMFWMNLDDFCTYFEFINVLYYHEDWVNDSVDLKIKKGEARPIVLTVTETTPIYFRVAQTDERGMQHKSKYEYLYIDIAVYDQTTAWPHAKTPMYWKGRDTVLKAKLRKGTYVVAVRAEGKDMAERDVVLSTYSEAPIRMKPKNKKAVNDMLIDGWVLQARTRGEKSQLEPLDVWVHECAFDHGTILYYRSRDTRKWIELELELQLENMVASERDADGTVKKIKGANPKLKFKINPGGEHWVIVQQKPGTGSFSWSSSYEYSYGKFKGDLPSASASSDTPTFDTDVYSFDEDFGASSASVQVLSGTIDVGSFSSCSSDSSSYSYSSSSSS